MVRGLVRPLRIVTWNAAMAMHRKFGALAELRPDIAIIPECANLPTITSKGMPPINTMVWVGATPNKGLGVFGFGDYRIELCQTFDPRLQWIAPIEVNGPHSFFLLAAWCMNHRTPATYPWRPYRQIEPAIRHYANRLRLGDAVIAGDFNNNSTWDKPGRADNFSATTSAAATVGLVSAYHSFNVVEFGQEPDPTLYWQTRKADGRTYHIDFCFIPARWLPYVTSVSIGDFETWVGSGLSDHTPLVVEVALPKG
jgi:exodeoxyribonuclease-3